MNDLEGVLPGDVLADGDAAAVVLDLDDAFVHDGDPNPSRVAGHRLVDRVVDELPPAVVEPARVGRADVHAGPAPNGLEPFEDLDAFRGVVGAGALPGARCRRAVAIARRGRARSSGRAAARDERPLLVGPEPLPISRS